MPSYLTRSVFQRLILNKPIVHRGCLHQSARAVLAYRMHINPLYKQKRSIWWWSKKPVRKVKEYDATPGLETLVSVNDANLKRTRPPPQDELEESFTEFFNVKQQKQEKLADHEADAAHTAFVHLQKLAGDEKESLTSKTLMQALRALTRDPTEQHLKLARLLFKELDRRAQVGKESSGHKHCRLFIEVLSKTGNTSEALEFMQDYLKKDASYVPSNEWLALINGFSLEKNENALMHVFELQRTYLTKAPDESASLIFMDQSRSLIIYFYAAIKEDLEQAKKLYSEALDTKAKVAQPHVRAVLMLALKQNDLKWAKDMIDRVISSNPGIRLWDVVFLWAAAVGKGVEEIDRMMQVMERRTPESEVKLGRIRRPDVQTINALIEWANSKNDPYLGERFMQLGQKWGIQPDAQSYILQMRYRLSVNDIDGARASYKALLGEELTDNEDLPLLNALIRAMIEGRRHPVEHIMVYVQDLNDRKVRFEPATVAKLALLHLHRDELHDLIDLLHTHTLYYSLDDRKMIRSVLVDFLFDDDTDVGLKWDAYSILHHVFPETDRETRTRIMTEFFARDRADLGFHAFRQMRELVGLSNRATSETWVHLFTGIADTKDEETLETAANQLKMDMQIDTDTRIRNALMMAYTACGQGRRALKYWEEINASREGPTYSSIHLAFRACEVAAWGDETAKAIWTRLRNMDIEITRDMFASYIGALAGNGLFDEVQQLIQGCEKVFGYAPDLFILGTYLNATQGVVKQKDTAQWISDNFPELWKELEVMPFWTDPENGKIRVKIDRRVTP